MKHSSSNSRWAGWMFGLVLFGSLALAMAGAPADAAASQVPAQPYVTQPSANTTHPPANSTAGEEQNETNEYRHAPIVQTLARLMHVDVETAARVFEFTNFAIIVLAIVIPLVRFMPKLLRRRSQKLQHDLASARKLTEDANARLSAVEAKLASIDQEIAKFRAEVEQEIARDEERTKASLEEERARIVASAEQEISTAAAQARRGLRHFAADLAIDKAVKQLVLTPEADRALIEEFVRETVDGGRK